MYQQQFQDTRYKQQQEIQQLKATGQIHHMLQQQVIVLFMQD